MRPAPDSRLHPVGTATGFATGVTAPPPRSASAGLFLISAGALLFQVTLVRIFSAAIWYHFAFLVVSIALFGIGASGVAMALRRPPAAAGAVAKRNGRRVPPAARALVPP